MRAKRARVSSMYILREAPPFGRKGKAKAKQKQHLCQSWPILGFRCSSFAAILGHLGPTCPILGLFWEPFWASWGLFWALRGRLEPFWRLLGTKSLLETRVLICPYAASADFRDFGGQFGAQNSFIFFIQGGRAAVTARTVDMTNRWQIWLQRTERQLSRPTDGWTDGRMDRPTDQPID